MSEKDIEKLLKTVGIGAGVVTTLFIIGLGAIVYRNYYQIQLYRKQVSLIDKQLASGKV